MSRATIQDLRDQVSKSREELRNAEADLADAIMAEASYKTGDRVRITTPQCKLTFGGGEEGDFLHVIKSEKLPDKVEMGRVTKVLVTRGHLKVQIAGDTKTGAPGKRELRIASDATVEKVED